MEVMEASTMEDKRSRRYFAREFKVKAVELPFHGNKRAVEVARNLGIRTEIIYAERTST